MFKIHCFKEDNCEKYGFLLKTFLGTELYY